MRTCGLAADMAQRAVSTYDAMQTRLFDAPTGLYSDAAPHRLGRRSWADLWPFANAWSATCDIAGLDATGRYGRDLDARRAALVAYDREGTAGQERPGGAIGFSSRPVPPLGAGGDVYFDDNAWIALALLRQYRLTREEHVVALARRVFDFAVTGWSTKRDWASPGGLRWAEPAWSDTRNTCAAAPVAEIGVLLYQATGDSAPLEWATRIYSWVRATLLLDGGCYADRIDPDGSVHAELWSYNQGTMIGAGLLLYEATGEQHYLDEARATGAASLSWLETPAELDRQGPPFFSIYLRNALMLGHHDEDASYGELGIEYAERRWRSDRDVRSGLFVRDGHRLGPTAGMVSIYGLLAGSEPRP